MQSLIAAIKTLVFRWKSVLVDNYNLGKSFKAQREYICEPSYCIPQSGGGSASDIGMCGPETPNQLPIWFRSTPAFPISCPPVLDPESHVAHVDRMGRIEQ